MSRGGYAWGMGTHALLLTLNGGHQMYGQQAGRTRPTGMYSSLLCFFQVLPVFFPN